MFMDVTLNILYSAYLYKAIENQYFSSPVGLYVTHLIAMSHKMLEI